ncbi:unnamed protein product [Blepharisma stoltei]|uniref:Uncharacterized protein n=1 Tax=Blepharisma stoltei TaxID=1481888 RepID=A0AAU9I934_9CILI|nr:unnamed protein product [Blepharisma stoltei]
MLSKLPMLKIRVMLNKSQVEKAPIWKNIRIYKYLPWDIRLNGSKMTYRIIDFFYQPNWYKLQKIKQNDKNTI